MEKDSKVRVILALIVFVLSSITYLLTVAPTVSFWDCGEFIACTNILGIPHPPGTPLFMLIGRAFIVLTSAFSSDVAYRVNLISVFASAAAVMFGFLFTEKLITLVFKQQRGTFISFTGGLVGALLINFSDTFWFNAVEAEVYGLAMFIVMIVSWLSLKWVDYRGTPAGDRILLLICYLAFLGIGFNLYTLMTIPAIFILIHIVDHPINMEIVNKGRIAFLIIFLLMGLSFIGKYGLGEGLFFLAIFGSAFAVGMYYVIGIFYVEKWRELLIVTFTGTLLCSMIYATGLFLYLAGAALVIAVAFVLMVQNQAYRSRGVLSIWLCVFALLGFSSHVYIPIRSALNPRIDENNPENWDAFKGFLERKQYGSESMIARAFNRRASLGNQMFSHPHMGYGGYLLAQYLPWKVGEGTSRTPDNRYLGVPEYVPDEDAPDVIRFGKRVPKQMEFMNPYSKRYLQVAFFILFHIPLLWGGILAFRRNQPFGIYILSLYLLSSLGLMFYLNFADGIRPDLEPFRQWVAQGADTARAPGNVHMEVRERDYFYVPAYMFASILLGLSAAFLLLKMQAGRKQITGMVKAAGVGLLTLAFVVPCFSNFREHDRSGVYVPYDYAKNLLESCRPNSILFTNGDNDTFPLWFMQEVEKVRMDVRVVNLSLGNTDWYIHQLLEQDPKVVLGFSHEQINLLGPQANGLTSPAEHTLGKTGLKVTLESRDKKPYYKVQDILVMNIVQNNYPERPIHFAVTVSNPNMMGLEKYMVMEGMVYTLTDQIQNQTLSPERTAFLVDTVYAYRGLTGGKVFLNSDTRGLLSNYFATNHRLGRWAQEQYSALEKEETSLKAIADTAASDSAKSAARARLDKISAEKAEKLEIAEKYISRTGELMPWDWRHYYFGSQLYRALHKNDKAEEMLKAGLALDKQQEAFSAQLGQMYSEEGRYPEAESIYLKLLDRGSADFQMVYALSEVFEKQGKYAQAKESLDKWLQDNSTHQYAQYIRRKVQDYERKLLEKPMDPVSPVTDPEAGNGAEDSL